LGRFWAVVRQQPHPSVSTDAVRNAMLSKRDPVSALRLCGYPHGGSTIRETAGCRFWAVVRQQPHPSAIFEKGGGRMHHLSIDLETYSSVPIAKAGAQKYIQSPDFEILLFAYSLDGGDVQIIDLAQGELLPQWLASALSDPQYIKHAYNASFEWGCLSKFMGTLPIDQWRCTMFHGLYCGYTAGLDATGKALGLPADKQKLSTGKALIRYFCVPCAPTKTNGGRTRNYPRHDPAKWALFKEYCIGDVTTEMEILHRLENFPVPPELEKQWQTDVLINARGVAVDMDMVRGALWIGETTRDQLTEEAVTLSGLDNPNSVKQLMQWLEEELDEELTDLRKDTVSRLLNGNLTNDTARRMLEIRQELGKTSTKKYNAIEAAVCADGRVRGLLQFYGANRTGRWAGRLVQVQNLPRTYVEPLPLARDLVKRRETASLRALFGSVPDTLSQLIRTSFIAEPGNALVDADFSAIEARVISWLAGESWRLDVFRTHGKIYEASASQMFGVPLERIKKGNPEYALRQKGKVAELALGYQGSTGALIKMGALDMGLTEAELPDIVNRWRDANKRIRDLWYSMEAAAVQVIQTGQPVGLRSLVLAREMDAGNNLDFLTIRLPSGRKLYYACPSLGQNQWGKPSITYMGMDQTTKKWKLIETYGGKLVENCVQAIARDCLAEAIERLEAANYPVVFHVHDEVVVECAAKRASLDDIAAIMGQPVSWAPDLPLGADGWVGAFYRKD
jgi:DNA polymerase